jgi:hypothetical protein
VATLHAVSTRRDRLADWLLTELLPCLAVIAFFVIVGLALGRLGV